MGATTTLFGMDSIVEAGRKAAQALGLPLPPPPKRGRPPKRVGAVARAAALAPSTALAALAPLPAPLQRLWAVTKDMEDEYARRLVQ